MKPGSLWSASHWASKTPSTVEPSGLEPSIVDVLSRSLRTLTPPFQTTRHFSKVPPMRDGCRAAPSCVSITNAVPASSLVLLFGAATASDTATVLSSSGVTAESSKFMLFFEAVLTCSANGGVTSQTFGCSAICDANALLGGVGNILGRSFARGANTSAIKTGTCVGDSGAASVDTGFAGSTASVSAINPASISVGGPTVSSAAISAEMSWDKPRPRSGTICCIASALAGGCTTTGCVVAPSEGTDAGFGRIFALGANNAGRDVETLAVAASGPCSSGSAFGNAGATACTSDIIWCSITGCILATPEAFDVECASVSGTSESSSSFLLAFGTATS
mmetsp:Transcript_53515/g.106544  ORF Transcript_53515/g.106544 Transcript_53515/m.106544 type:complete len:335 (+) Transcript_53515:1142-2146(+)